MSLLYPRGYRSDMSPMVMSPMVMTWSCHLHVTYVHVTYGHTTVCMQMRFNWLYHKPLTWLTDHAILARKLFRLQVPVFIIHSIIATAKHYYCHCYRQRLCNCSHSIFFADAIFTANLIAILLLQLLIRILLPRLLGNSCIRAANGATAKQCLNNSKKQY